MKLSRIEQTDDHLVLDLAGTRSRFHYYWLRDNCPGCRSKNGQRLHETSSLDPDIRPQSIDTLDDQLHVAWSDGMRSTYSLEFLTRFNYDKPAPQTELTDLWQSDKQQQLRWHDYPDVCRGAAEREAWLQDVATYGFGLLRNVPPVEETIFDVVDLFGYVRATNYGRLFEVRAEENADNLAYTPVPLSVHTDNPYRDPCPTLQLLHCLVHADEGGVTALADGFYAADKLRRESPDAFDMLSQHDVSFHYASDAAILSNTDRIISQDGRGKIKKIRLNNRSLAPLALPFDLVLSYYAALLEFRNILDSKESQIRFTLNSGDLLLLDNERVLHGRIGDSIGARHLQGCYADRDGLLSTLEVLKSRRLMT